MKVGVLSPLSTILDFPLSSATRTVVSREQFSYKSQAAPDGAGNTIERLASNTE